MDLVIRDIPFGIPFRVNMGSLVLGLNWFQEWIGSSEGAIINMGEQDLKSRFEPWATVTAAHPASFERLCEAVRQLSTADTTVKLAG